MLWAKSLGPVELGLQGSFGDTKQSFLANDTVANLNVKNMYNLSVSLQYADFLVRVAQSTINSPTTIPLSPQFVLNFELKDKYTSVGTQFDNGKALALAEWAKRSPLLEGCTAGV
jgi:hypothetical protein